jgi:hypothetical protein
MSSLGKDLLVFDAAQAADSDNVGAFLRASDGTLLTHTDVGGKKALDVNVANALTIDVDLDQSTDSVAIGDGTNLVAVSASGELSVAAVDFDIRNLAFATDKVDVSGSSVSISGDVNVTQGTSPWVVSATDLDIRDLAFATDKVDVSGSTVELGATTLAALETITVEQGTSPWVVSATDLDIRDLAFATDKVDVTGSEVSLDAGTLAALENIMVTGNVADDAADAGNPVKVGSRAISGLLSAISAGNDRADMVSDMYRRLYINDSSNIGSKSAAVSVADTEIALSGSPLAGRRRMIIENLSSQAIFVGPTGVTTSSGLRIAAGGNLTLEIGQDVALFAISANASAKDVRVFELA